MIKIKVKNKLKKKKHSINLINNFAIINRYL